jgi:hypothetical protein
MEYLENRLVTTSYLWAPDCHNGGHQFQSGRSFLPPTSSGRNRARGEGAGPTRVTVLDATFAALLSSIRRFDMKSRLHRRPVDASSEHYSLPQSIDKNELPTWCARVIGHWYPRCSLIKLIRTSERLTSEIQGRHNMTNEPITIDSTLLVAAKKRDGRAFECLMSRYQARILSVAFRRTRNREDAQDVETWKGRLPSLNFAMHRSKRGTRAKLRSQCSCEEKNTAPSTRHSAQFLAILYIHTLMLVTLVVFSRNVFSTAIRTVLIPLIR